MGASWTATGAGWLQRAACTQADADQLFGRAAAGRAARTLCARCPVHRECLAHALSAGEDFGVWGGMPPNDRRVILQACPTERDWPGRLQREDTTHGLADALRDSGVPGAQRVARVLDELTEEHGTPDVRPLFPARADAHAGEDQRRATVEEDHHGHHQQSRVPQPDPSTTSPPRPG